MKWNNLLLGGALLGGAVLWAQSSGVMSLVPPAQLRVPRMGAVEQKLKLQLQPGYHANSDKPNDEYLIPMRLTWDKGPVEAVGVAFPKPTLEKSEFSDKPLSVYTGSFEVSTKFRRAAGAAPGPALLTGKLRYQACNDKMCLPPKNIDIKVPLLVE